MNVIGLSSKLYNMALPLFQSSRKNLLTPAEHFLIENLVAIFGNKNQVEAYIEAGVISRVEG